MVFCLVSGRCVPISSADNTPERKEFCRKSDFQYVIDHHHSQVHLRICIQNLLISISNCFLTVGISMLVCSASLLSAITKCVPGFLWTLQSSVYGLTPKGLII